VRLQHGARDRSGPIPKLGVLRAATKAVYRPWKAESRSKTVSGTGRCPGRSGHTLDMPAQVRAEQVTDVRDHDAAARARCVPDEAASGGQQRSTARPRTGARAREALSSVCWRTATQRLPKLTVRVRFPSPAPPRSPGSPALVPLAASDTSDPHQTGATPAPLGIIRPCDSSDRGRSGTAWFFAPCRARTASSRC